MKESIYTIPISEVFEPKAGCPLCTLHSSLEERWVDYITGAAMMEPDVRVDTNRHGFCANHLTMMLTRRERLSVALILQTRLGWIDENLNNTPTPTGFLKKHAPNGDNTCFICEKIDAELARILKNITKIWEREPEFRGLYGEQQFLCHPHALQLLETARTSLKGESQKNFSAATIQLTRKKLRAVKADIDAFCELFDYRSAGSRPDSEVAAAVEHAVKYLSGK